MTAHEEKARAFADHVQRLYHHLIEQYTPGVEGLSKREIEALLFVGAHVPCVMKEIAEALHLTSSAATATVDKLIGKGLVSRFRSEADRRFVSVELTGKGQSVYEVTLQQLCDTTDAMLGALDETEQRDLFTLLSRIPGPAPRVDGTG